MTDWLGRWSYPGIFVCVFIGNFGIPVPEEVVLLAAGLLAGRHVLELGTLYIIAILSAVAGDTCGLWLDAPVDNSCSGGFRRNPHFYENATSTCGRFSRCMATRLFS
jgi:membrane protein YqaA with SNARE-associated domain